MHNPFESGHIKNYMLLYVGVVVIMVLFFIAANLFREVNVETLKRFNTSEEVNKLEEFKLKFESKKEKRKKDEKIEPSKFKLLDKAY
ncbi:MAG: hypothetical protein COB17_10515 [Sulfurimonas sp.]|nr:MAG: hypothetical protein COB17_10515 [Sulfurimonas sp.]